MKRILPPLAALVGALLAGLRGHHTLAIVIGVGAFVLVLVSVVAPDRMAALEAGVRRLVLAFVHALGLVASALVLPVLWLVFRGARVDPLGFRGAGSERWVRIGGSHSTGPFSTVPVSRPGDRWRVRGVVLVALALIGGFAFVRTRSESSAPEVADRPKLPGGVELPIASGDDTDGGIPWRPFAFESEPWGKDVMDEYHETGLVADPETAWQERDFAGTYHNVADRIRRSWAPKETSLTVWFLGGSAAWGVGQRDEHTIPSMLARRAEADGVGIKVVNMAVPGFVSWQETAVLRRELARRKAPDLVVVYHGSNDLVSLIDRATNGATPLDRPGNLLDASAAGFELPPLGEPVTDLDVIADAGLTVLREEDRAMEAATDAAGVPLVKVWQPSLWSGRSNRWDATAIAAEGGNEGYLEAMRSIEDAVVDRLLVDDVVDLRTALDDSKGPTFFDQVHTNEAGAALVADALWDQIAPQVLALAGKR